MGDDRINMVITHIDMGYLVTLPELRGNTYPHPTGSGAPTPTAKSQGARQLRQMSMSI